jgi:hypothetical protein
MSHEAPLITQLKVREWHVERIRLFIWALERVINEIERKRGDLLK